MSPRKSLNQASDLCDYINIDTSEHNNYNTSRNLKINAPKIVRENSPKEEKNRAKSKPRKGKNKERAAQLHKKPVTIVEFDIFETKSSKGWVNQKLLERDDQSKSIIFEYSIAMSDLGKTQTILIEKDSVKEDNPDTMMTKYTSQRASYVKPKLINTMRYVRV